MSNIHQEIKSKSNSEKHIALRKMALHLCYVYNKLNTNILKITVNI